ncbi:MAG: FliH/SctL family protein [Thiohalomonadales bacterium]
MRKNTSDLMGEASLKPVERWQAPALGDEEISAVDVLSLSHITVEKIERIRQQAYTEAYDEAYAKGLSQGEADGLQKIQPRLDLLQKLTTELSSPFDDLDDEIENQLSHLAILLAKQIIRREIEHDPGQIIAIVREAMALLPVTSNQLHVHVHPEDLQVLKDIMKLRSQDTRLHIDEDVALQRGDCKVFTDYSSIDATLETRMTAIIAEMLGGHRSSDIEASDADPQQRS